jgi:hypothetical protein
VIGVALGREAPNYRAERGCLLPTTMEAPWPYRALGGSTHSPVGHPDVGHLRLAVLLEQSSGVGSRSFLSRLAESLLESIETALTGPGKQARFS